MAVEWIMRVALPGQSNWLISTKFGGNFKQCSSGGLGEGHSFDFLPRMMVAQIGLGGATRSNPEAKLHTARATKRGGGKLGTLLRKTSLAAGHFEHLRDLVGKYALATHARTKVRVIQFAGAHRADAIQDFFFSIRKMPREPVFKKRRDRVREAQDDKTGEARAGVCGCRQNPGHLVIGQ